MVVFFPRARRALENRQTADDEKMNTLSAKVKEWQFAATESESKYDEVCITEMPVSCHSIRKCIC